MGSREIELETALEKTVLEIIHNRHYGRADDPNGDAQAEYLNDQMRDLARQLYPATEPIEHTLQETWVAFVRQFFTTYGHEIRPAPPVTMHELDVDTVKLRQELIVEEVKEMFDATAANDPVAVFDALLDLVYVTIGAMLAYGFPAEAGMAEVQRSNMTKLGADGKPIYGENGKVVKGPNFEEPQLGPLLEEARR